MTPVDAACPQITASVVTYNSESCLPRFLDSLQRQTDVAWEARFHDNASTDGTAALLRQAGLGQVFVNDTNIGYGRGHNRNLSRSRGSYVLLLNPDLEFEAGLFNRLSDYLDRHADCAMAGPCILEGSELRPFPPRYFYPGEGMVALQGGLRRRDIAWISGCCVIIRRHVFESLNGFDPDYFLYQEDTDLCLRVRRAGYRIGHAEEAAVRHLHRQSQRELSEYDCACRVFRGSTIFLEKHYPESVSDMIRFQYWLSVVLLWFTPGERRTSTLPAAVNRPRLLARRNVCAAWLERNRCSRFRIAPVTARICARQCVIALEWMRLRRCPLDDY